MADRRFFSSALFRYLEDLEANNQREWFQEQKDRYESELKEPALAFIAAFAPHLEAVSPHFRADPRPVGGSLFRIYRDVRFSKDKRPYKTHVGIHFRHALAKNVHAPGFYLHLEPRRSFFGAGIWRPERGALGRIRDAIVEDPENWRTARDHPRFRARFELDGEALKRGPRGYPADHPHAEDLKRKDFVAISSLARNHVTGGDLGAVLEEACHDAAPFMSWLCEALDVPF